MEQQQQKSLLGEDMELYRGEKEPDSKNVVVSLEEDVEMEQPLMQEDEEEVARIALGRRGSYSTGLLSCLGLGGNHFGTDMEVCVLGLFAPCVLYGSNMEHLYPRNGAFGSHCMAYSGLYFLGNCLLNCNWLAPCFSSPSRTAVRRRFNLQGNCETLAKSLGCCTEWLESEDNREMCESTCDFGIHFCCHPCALCQEAREIRRRIPQLPRARCSQMQLCPPGEQFMA